MNFSDEKRLNIDEIVGCGLIEEGAGGRLYVVVVVGMIAWWWWW